MRDTGIPTTHNAYLRSCFFVLRVLERPGTKEEVRVVVVGEVGSNVDRVLTVTKSTSALLDLNVNQTKSVFVPVLDLNGGTDDTNGRPGSAQEPGPGGWPCSARSHFVDCYSKLYGVEKGP